MALNTAECSTSALAYARILFPIKLMRAGTIMGTALGRALRILEPAVKPHEALVLRSTTSKRMIKINVHLNQAALRTRNKPTAVHLNWHGGGWILPGLGQDSAFIRHILANPLLADYPLAILDCDYALSPEYPCPADTEDARDVIEYVLSRPEKYDASRLTLGGFSTGGTIALGLSAAMGKEKKEDKEEWDTYEHPIKAVFTVYPEVTWLGDRDVVEVPRKTKKGLAGFVLPLWFSRYITDAHFFCPIRNSGISKAQEMRRKEELASRPIVSPLNGEMRDFSPLIVMYTAQYDHLRRDAEKLRDRFARDKGIRLHGRRIDGVGHGWDQLVKKNQVGYIEKDEIYDMAARMIATVGGLEVFMK